MEGRNGSINLELTGSKGKSLNVGSSRIEVIELKKVIPDSNGPNEPVSCMTRSTWL